jgi:hypothetical protein
MPIRGKHLVLLTFLAVASFVSGGAATARAEVNVNIHIGPPPIVVAEPPVVVMIPQSRVSFVPDPHVDVFFYEGYWWSPRGAAWYRARAYNGPWAVVERWRVPGAIIYVPRDYRARYGQERHIPYGQWKKNHDRWERENRKAHKKWEKERKQEMKERERHEKRAGSEGRSGGHDRDDGRERR